MKVIENFNITKKNFIVDPYGIANELSIKFKVNRNYVLDMVFKFFSNYLINNGYVSEHYRNFMDQELKLMIKYLPNSSIGGASVVEEYIASCVSMCEIVNNKYLINDLKT